MPDEGYLHSKIRENWEEISSLKNMFKECSIKLKILNGYIERNQTCIDEIDKKVKKLGEYFDPMRLDRSINLTVNKNISEQYTKISKKLDKKLDAMMKHIQNNKRITQEKMLDEIGNAIVDHTNIFYEAIGNILISYYEILLENGIIDESFEQVIAWHADPESIDRIIILDFEQSKMKILIGKDRVRKWAKSKLFIPDDSGPTRKLDIEGKTSGIIGLGSVIKKIE